ncbi:MAG: L,D-transpeptidase [Lachnospiraceae bacterium]|nr:L,D-transpeptidase [Lachnospiraceae bacterium]
MSSSEFIPGMEKLEAPKKSRGGLIAGALIAAVLLMLLASTYVTISKDYETRFLPGTVINGIGVGGLTSDYVEKRVAADAEGYTLELVFRNAVEVIDGQEIGLHFLSDGEAKGILNNQEPLEWIFGFFGRKYMYTISPHTEFDEGLLASVLKALPELDPENEIAPENAGLELGEDNVFSIIPEVQGTTLKEEALLEAAEEAVRQRLGKLELTSESGVYESPAVLADNPDLVSQCETLNRFLDASVTYIRTDGSKKLLDRDELAGWISREENGFYYLDEALLAEKAGAFVSELARETNVTKNSRPFNSTRHGQVEVPCDPYGFIVDEAAESAALLEDLKSGKVDEREPIYSEHALDLDPNMGGTYIEVDVKLQHVYFYIDGALALESDCVSGTLLDPTRMTPYGVFSIYLKDQNRTLRGTRLPDGSYPYSSFVKYWMAFYWGCGFHDASWRAPAEFGGNTYLRSGSHGCVNLPESAAAKMFELSQVGTPVVVFYAE